MYSRIAARVARTIRRIPYPRKGAPRHRAERDPARRVDVRHDAGDVAIPPHPRPCSVDHSTHVSTPATDCSVMRPLRPARPARIWRLSYICPTSPRRTSISRRRGRESRRRPARPLDVGCLRRDRLQCRRRRRNRRGNAFAIARSDDPGDRRRRVADELEGHGRASSFGGLCRGRRGRSFTLRAALRRSRSSQSRSRSAGRPQRRCILYSSPAAGD